MSTVSVGFLERPAACSSAPRRAASAPSGSSLASRTRPGAAPARRARGNGCRGPGLWLAPEIRPVCPRPRRARGSACRPPPRAVESVVKGSRLPADGRRLELAAARTCLRSAARRGQHRRGPLELDLTPSPGNPFSRNAGVWRVEVANEAFPCSRSRRRGDEKDAPASERSASRPLSSWIWVPTGTSRIASFRARRHGCYPSRARRAPPLPCGWAKGSRVERSSVARRTMEPPSPPRPLSGPPRGLYFSRLKETLPSPPLPAHDAGFIYELQRG